VKTKLYMMRLVRCLSRLGSAKRATVGICVLAFCASCVDVTTEPSAKSLHKTDSPASRKAGSLGSRKAGSLTVFFTGNELGELKPCGCSGGQLGGLSRRAAVFNRVSKDKRLIIDTGSLVKSQSEQDLIKFNIIIEAFRRLDYDLVNLSEKDIETAQNLGLLSNPIVGFISPYGTGEKIAGRFRDQYLLKGKYITISVLSFNAETSPINQIREVFPREPGQQSVNILIINRCDDAIISSIAEMGTVDCIVCPAESDEPMVIGEANKRPLVFSVGRFGRYVCGLQITEDRGQKTEDRRQRTEDRGQITEAAGDEDKLKLRFFSVPVEEDLEEEASLVQLYKDYQQLVKEGSLLEKHPRFTLSNGLEYAGSESCKACHEYEYGKWSRNVHAHTYAILEREGSQFDPECVICHVVGMDYESGFISEHKTGHLQNVGCENCHGPGSEHIKTGGIVGFTGPKSACIDCHTPEHSGDYAGNEGAFLEKIVHWREPKPLAPVK